MKYSYQARNKGGQIRSGTVEASNREGALGLLKSHGLYVTLLQEFAEPLYARRLALFDYVSRKEVVSFSRQVAIMFKSKVPLTETFRVLAKQTRNRSFRNQIVKIAEAVEGGTPLSKALSLYPKVFTPFYINMVKAGEASGKLTDIFNYLADYLEREQYFRSRITGAMVYPAFVLVVFIGVLTLIVAFVIPQLSMLLKESGQELPLITQVVIGLSDFARQNGWVILVALVTFAFTFARLIKTAAGKRLFDRYILRIPMIGGFLRKLYLARFALNLTTLVAGGLPIAKALEISGDVVGNEVYRDIIIRTREEVSRGEQISDVLQAYPWHITPLFLQMVIVGEKTGTLDTSLNNVVSFYQRDIDRSLDSFVRLIEPIFIICLGGIVAALMGAVMIPLYTFGF